ncbi:hypothetical protein KEM54_000003 [Ascosphaera aggregata]|nr:hypothetical protein KEM54_000003 [Ascosphaera aggregata]
MLKSTYKGASELPPGWTQHRAPSGRLYYYHAETKKSTYHRPVAAPESVQALPTPPTAAAAAAYYGTYPPLGAPGQLPYAGYAGYAGYPSVYPGYNQQQSYYIPYGQQQQQQPRRKLEDWPKHKYPIPGHDGWYLIKTKLRRRFVYNSKTEESFWKFPEEIIEGVKEFDRREKERKESKARGVKTPEPEAPNEKRGVMERPPEGPSEAEGPVKAFETRETIGQETEDSSEYEEVEVTDEEDISDPQNPSKRARTDEGGLTTAQDGAAPLEFSEEDIAYQLAAMEGDDYGASDLGYNEDWGEAEDDYALTEEDAVALFHDLLEDYNINPYSPWERVIEEGRIIDDSRYTVLPNMKSRREVYGSWSKEKIALLREERARQEKKDPRIRYISFIGENVNGKLYWPEFKRKFKKSDEMRDMKLSEKEKEKIYRDHVARLKLPESKKVEDLRELLKSLPLDILNNRSTTENLPTRVLVDLRYISLPPATRDSLIQSYIASLPEAPTAETKEITMSAEEREEAEKKRAEREKREQALRDREKRVEMERQRMKREQRSGQQMLMREEIKVERAMRVCGEGIRSYVERDPGSLNNRDDSHKVGDNEPSQE